MWIHNGYLPIYRSHLYTYSIGDMCQGKKIKVFVRLAKDVIKLQIHTPNSKQSIKNEN